MATNDTEHVLRVLTAEWVDDTEDGTGELQCPVCGRVVSGMDNMTYCCEGTKDELQACERCIDAFETDEQLVLPPTDMLADELFTRLWTWAQAAKTESEPWPQNEQLFHELQAIKNSTGAKHIRVTLLNDILQINADNRQQTFSMAQIRRYRGDALQDMILAAFKQQEDKSHEVA